MSLYSFLVTATCQLGVLHACKSFFKSLNRNRYPIHVDVEVGEWMLELLVKHVQKILCPINRPFISHRKNTVRSTAGGLVCTQQD